MDQCKKIIQWFTIIVIFTMGIFHLYTGFFGTFETFYQRFTHLALALLIIFLLNPYKTSHRTLTIFLNSCIVIALFISLGFLFFNYDYVMTGRFPFVTPLTTGEMILGIVFIALVLEATRKLTGPILPLVAIIFVIYAFTGPFLPSILGHGGYTLSSIIDMNYMSTEGIFSIPLGASANYIAMFIIFGAFLARSGVGSLLMDIAMGLAGRFSGGPAKVAVVASVFTGVMSGSAVSNVLTSGTFTIPLMKKIGYKPHFAAGVEASASTGSQIMPPVMGIIAFMMAQYTGIPYIQIAGYALLPAILYFWGVGVMVHYEAVKLKLKGLPKEELPDWKSGLKKKWHLLAPIFIMLTLLIQGFSPSYAVSYSILSIVIIASLRKETRMGIKEISGAIQDGVKGMLMIAVATATAGMISGVFGLTGLGIRFSTSLSDLSGGYIILALVLTAFVSIILGLGLPPSASYIIQIAVTIPALVQVLEAYEVDVVSANALLLAHMFVMYFAAIAVITPPDAIASFAAAGIAKSPPMLTAFTASKLAFVAYFIPFLFVLNPAYLMIGTLFEISLAIVGGVLGVLALGIGFQGYLSEKIGWLSRFYVLSAALLIFIPLPITNIIGIVLILLFLFTSLIYKNGRIQNPINTEA
ncbi:TRAP transporter permease [Halalkalibacterium ligniniphilum]|uniref:TRAP transporter permease n=1 Tax=Halalkalibacterium ligniniphilum TaxID=1134413 RepID=UPI000348A371|nr:TRAP transporter permease [Halalkalibacterium ligniniphilum]